MKQKMLLLQTKIQTKNKLFSVVSDKKLKKNIVRIDDSLNKLLSLKGMYFEWNKDKFPQMHLEDGRQMGLIAQEVEKVFPEAVSISDDGIRSVNYSMFIAPMIEALKGLNKRIAKILKLFEEQNNEMASLKGEFETKMNKLEVENAKLKKELSIKAKDLEVIKTYLRTKDRHVNF